MRETFGSTCHGAGRALSRNKSRNNLDYGDVLKRLEAFRGRGKDSQVLWARDVSASEGTGSGEGLHIDMMFDVWSFQGGTGEQN